MCGKCVCACACVYRCGAVRCGAAGFRRQVKNHKSVGPLASLPLFSQRPSKQRHTQTHRHTERVKFGRQPRLHFADARSATPPLLSREHTHTHSLTTSDLTLGLPKLLVSLALLPIIGLGLSAFLTSFSILPHLSIVDRSSGLRPRFTSDLSFPSLLLAIITPSIGLHDTLFADHASWLARVSFESSDHHSQANSLLAPHTRGGPNHITSIIITITICIVSNLTRSV